MSGIPLLHTPDTFNPNRPGPVYDFTDAPSDIRSIIHCINFLGDDLVGAEIGVCKGFSFMTLLHNCSIKKLYGVDSYLPYDDYLIEKYDGVTANYSIDEKQIKYNRAVCYNNIEYSGHKDKVIFLEKDSNDAANDIEDASLDFIFIDTYMTYEQACQDIETWYPKVKPGGIFAGHDYRCPVIEQVITNFRKKNSIDNRMSIFDNTFIWYK